ncbi:MAG: nucleotidyltransferase domain-containing protein [Bacilli bacterium]|nr:nucleotidyltransferase domain-containing protein [Bacilli bacterium]
MNFNQIDYIKNYNKSIYKTILFRVRKDNFDIMKKLKSVESVNGYINELIENDIHHNVLTIKKIKDKILPIFKKHNINEVYLFGSYARGEAKNTSDIDIYCESGNVKTLIEQGLLEDELTKALKKDVDIVFIGSKMDNYFKEQLEGDKIRIC